MSSHMLFFLLIQLLGCIIYSLGVVLGVSGGRIRSNSAVWDRLSGGPWRMGGKLKIQPYEGRQKVGLAEGFSLGRPNERVWYRDSRYGSICIMNTVIQIYSYMFCHKAFSCHICRLQMCYFQFDWYTSCLLKILTQVFPKTELALWGPCLALRIGDCGLDCGSTVEQPPTASASRSLPLLPIDFA